MRREQITNHHGVNIEEDSNFNMATCLLQVIYTYLKSKLCNSRSVFIVIDFCFLAALVVKVCSVLPTDDVALNERHLVLLPKRAELTENWR